MPPTPSTDFDQWLRAAFAATGEFTALVLLVAILDTAVSPLCSTYFNVIGDEVDWSEITVLFAGAGHDWDGAAFFSVTSEDGGALDNISARNKLRVIEDRLKQDRLVLNDGHFFDKWGRRMKVEEIAH